MTNHICLLLYISWFPQSFQIPLLLLQCSSCLKCPPSLLLVKFCPSFKVQLELPLSNENFHMTSPLPGSLQHFFEPHILTPDYTLSPFRYLPNQNVNILVARLQPSFLILVTLSTILGPKQMVKQNFLFFKIKIAFIVIIKMLHSHYKKLKPYKKVRKKK